MALEVVTNIDDLVAANPLFDDPVNEGDNHIQNLKIAVQKNLGGNDLSTQLKAVDVVALNADNKGAQVTGQVTVSDPTPLNPEELTRKDYVDAGDLVLQGQIDTNDTDITTLQGQVSTLEATVISLQAEIDDIKNGFDFTGPITAPDVTAV